MVRVCFFPWHFSISQLDAGTICWFWVWVSWSIRMDFLSVGGKVCYLLIFLFSFWYWFLFRHLGFDLKSTLAHVHVLCLLFFLFYPPLSAIIRKTWSLISLPRTLSCWGTERRRAASISLWLLSWEFAKLQDFDCSCLQLCTSSNSV